MTDGRLLVAVLLLATALGGTAAAQARPSQPTAPFRARSLEVNAGVLRLGGIDFGSATAELTRNQVPRAGFPLFRVSSELLPSAGVEGRLGFRITRALAVEGAFIYARPRLETRITSDSEDAAPTTATATIAQYLVDVSGVLHLTPLAFGRGGMPFVFGGGGYLRELDDGQALVETGRTYHAGGGVKYLVVRRPRGLVRGIGVRADARVYFRDGGFELDDEEPRRRFFAAGASLIVGF